MAEKQTYANRKDRKGLGNRSQNSENDYNNRNNRDFNQIDLNRGSRALWHSFNELIKGTTFQSPTDQPNVEELNAYFASVSRDSDYILTSGTNSLPEDPTSKLVPVILSTCT